MPFKQRMLIKSRPQPTQGKASPHSYSRIRPVRNATTTPQAPSKHPPPITRSNIKILHIHITKKGLSSLNQTHSAYRKCTAVSSNRNHFNPNPKLFSNHRCLFPQSGFTRSTQSFTQIHAPAAFPPPKTSRYW
jgi:hypothetical protein